MNIDHPRPDQTARLRGLWKLAFGDTDAFLDLFFSTAFSPTRCRCVTEGDEVLAALYWFEISCQDRRLAYLYAVATHPGHRGQGLCRRLMEDTLDTLASLGFSGALLVPDGGDLAAMYRRMGFVIPTPITEFSCAAAAEPVPLREISPEEFARLRREYLPEGGVLQEGESLVFLSSLARFYAGSDFLAAVQTDGAQLRCVELLGDPAAAGGILRALGFREGSFRAPGRQQLFALTCPLRPDCPAPVHFGFAFD